MNSTEILPSLVLGKQPTTKPPLLRESPTNMCANLRYRRIPHPDPHANFYSSVVYTPAIPTEILYFQILHEIIDGTRCFIFIFRTIDPVIH